MQPLRLEKSSASRAEMMAWLLLLAAYAVLVPLSWAWLRPGYLSYDEAGQIAQLQAWREGGPWIWRIGGGAIQRLLMAIPIYFFGPNDRWLRLPALLAVLAESILLYQILKPSLGQRVAVWAAIADLVCSATFIRAGSMLCPALLPVVFLAHAAIFPKCRRPWQLVFFGLSVALWSLDYEAWPMAALILGLGLAWQERTQPQRLLWPLAGCLLGAALLLSLPSNWRSYVSSRLTLSAPTHQGSYVWQNLRALFGWQDRALISGVPMHPFPPPWLWLPALLGLVPLLRRHPSMAVVLVIGSLPLALRMTDGEPHRLSLAYLVICAATGCGIALVWNRRVWRLLALALALSGVVYEAWAWQSIDPQRLQYSYNRSRNVSAAVTWLKREAPPGGWHLVDNLSPLDDAPLRFELDAAGIRRDGATPVALIAWDYLPALKGRSGHSVPLDCDCLRAPSLYFPSATELPRLEAIQRRVGRLETALRATFPVAVPGFITKTLDGPDWSDPWSRTIAWELWLDASLQINAIDPADFKRAAREPLVSGRFYDLAAAYFLPRAPALAQQLRLSAQRLDPRRQDLAFPALGS